jgi:predicted permease
MDLIRILLSRINALFRAKRLDADLDEELRAHIDLAVEENQKRGMSAQAARTQALRDFGGVTQTAEAYRMGRGIPFVEVLLRDSRYGLRQLRRNPGFTIAVIGTVALAIGANTAIFSIVNALMLKSLPYPQPERLGVLCARIVGPEASDQIIDLDGEQWERLRDNVPSLLSAISSGISSGVNLQAGERVQYLHGARISAHYLDVLGVQPFMGRNFSEAEDRPQGAKVAILSYAEWKTAFGSARNLLGQTIQLKGEPYTLIGVLPEGERTPLNADVYTALQPSREGEGGGTNFDAVVRLRDGATWQQADTELNRAWTGPIESFEKRNTDSKMVFYSVPLQTGQSAELRPKSLALMLAAGFILLIACGNLAGLTLVRVLRRTPEIAVRLALGASRWQIQRQLWVENLVLAFAGGLAGIGVGYAALRGLLSLLPEGFLPVAHVPLDGRVLGFTMAASLVTCILFGMLPASAARKVDIRASMASRASSGSRRLRLRETLIAGQVAMTVVLLAGSGLLIRTLIHLESLPPGFNPGGVLAAKASLDDVRYRDPAAFIKLLDESTAAMAQIPGVESAAVGLTLPYERALNDSVTLHDGGNAGKQFGTDVVYVTPDYFKVLQIPLLQGRGFTGSDGPDTQPVVMVNVAFARRFFPGESPVGHTLNEDSVIVGVVGNVATAPGIDDSGPLTSERTIYVPAGQMNGHMLQLVHVWFQPSWIVRTAAPVQGLTGQMQGALTSVEPSLPFSGFYSMNDLMAKTLATQRIEVALLGVMAALALLLSTVGIFGLVANIVAQRSREIGIRIALGSSIRRAMAQVCAPGVRASVAGLVLGLLCSAGALRVMRSVLYGVSVYDATTIVAVVATLGAVSLLAAGIPALRVSRIDPAQTLRDE